MFDVGFTEILLIGVVSLVVIGPERLPDVARTVGRWVGKMQRFVRGVRSDIANEFESGELKKLIGDQREQINELRTMVNTARKDFEKSSKEAMSDAGESFKAFEKTIKDDGEPAAGAAPGAGETGVTASGTGTGTGTDTGKVAGP